MHSFCSDGALSVVSCGSLMAASITRYCYEILLMLWLRWRAARCWKWIHEDEFRKIMTSVVARTNASCDQSRWNFQVFVSPAYVHSLYFLEGCFQRAFNQVTYICIDSHVAYSPAVVLSGSGGPKTAGKVANPPGLLLSKVRSPNVGMSTMTML